jgi:hypothetical protein
MSASVAQPLTLRLLSAGAQFCHRSGYVWSDTLRTIPSSEIESR